MWRHRGLEHFSSKVRVNHQSHFIDKEFQLKYTFRIVLSVAIGSLFIISPFYIFFNQNYEVFQSLAYQSAPELLEHLERERFWALSFFFTGFTAMLIFTSLLGYRMTGMIIGPIKVIRNHLRRLNRGDWNVGKASIRSNDEFHDFVDAFNYFYLTYRHHIDQELHALKKMNIDKESSETYSIWKRLIEEKEKQLAIESQEPLSVLSDVTDAEPPDSRHVS